MPNPRLYINISKAAEEGAFRGGDPEELQAKKEEKLREQKESGEFEQKEMDLSEAAEQADPGAVEEQTLKENEKIADKEAMAASLTAAKSVGFSHANAAEITPVKTEHKGDEKAPYPLDRKRKKQEPVEDSTPRSEENKHKIYSIEVLNRTPTGYPTREQEDLRREDMRRRGVLPEACVKAIEILKGAYKLQGRIDFRGLKVSIENKKGSTRKWYDPNNKETGSTKMYFDYGYIRNTKGVDGDHVDVYIGPNHEAKSVFVVHQMKAPEFSKFDEDKCMLGFDSAEEAKKAYLRQYNDPKFFGSMTELPFEKFKDKVLQTKTSPKMIKSKESE
jgi:hypothetical protein